MREKRDRAEDVTGRGLPAEAYERLPAEEALREVGLDPVALLDRLAEVVAFHDTDFRIVWANRAAADSAGLAPGELVGRHCYEAWHGRECPCEACPVQAALSSGEPAEGDIELADGRYWFMRASPVHDAEGRLLGAVEVRRDITRRRQAEEALRESEAKLRRAQKIARVGHWSWDIASGRAEWSDQVYEVFKAPRRPPSYEFARSFVHPDDLDLWESTIRDAVERREPFTHEYRAVRTDGETVWVRNETEAVFGERGELVGYAGTVQDITERRQTEQALRESERSLRSTLDGLSDHISLLDEQGRILLVNKSWRRFAEENGLSAEAVSEGTNYLAVCDEAVGDDAPQARAFAAGIRRVLAGDAPSFVLEYPCHSPGEQRWFIGRVTPFPGDGPRRVVVAHENITERKRARRAVRGLARFPSENPYPVMRIAQHGAVLFANTPAKALLRERGSGTGRQVPPDWCDLVARVLANRRTERTEVRYAGMTFALHVVPVASLGYANVYGVDITERKQAEEELRAERDRARRYLDLAPVTFVALDAAGVVTLINPRGCEILGRPAPEVVGRNWFDEFVPARERDRVRAIFRDLMAGRIEPREHAENPIVNRDGEERLIAWHNTVLPDAEGRGTGVLSSGVDITERKQAEEALRRSRGQLLHAQQLAHLGSWEYRIGSETAYWCDELYRIFSLEPRPGGMPYEAFLERIHPDDRERADREFARSIETGAPYDSEYRIVRPDGEVRVVHSRAEVASDEAGRPARIFGSAQDITARARAEEALRRREEQLRELAADLSRVEERTRRRLAANLHDDVAQTLATAKLKLQQLEQASAEVNADDLAQVRGLVDEALGGTRTAVLDLGPPVLYELDFTDALAWLVDRTGAEGGLAARFEADAGPCPLAEEVRVALFRATGELLRNVVRHVRAQNVTVRLARTEGQVRITVEDDGAGFDPETIRPGTDARGGFGLFGVRERIEYLGGRLEIDSAPGRGTRATLVAPARQGEQAT